MSPLVGMLVGSWGFCSLLLALGFLTNISGIASPLVLGTPFDLLQELKYHICGRAI